MKKFRDKIKTEKKHFHLNKKIVKKEWTKKKQKKQTVRLRIEEDKNNMNLVKKMNLEIKENRKK